jgi:lipoprotein-anchoring transpeptidase ErfK/SrfK
MKRLPAASAAATSLLLALLGIGPASAQETISPYDEVAAAEAEMAAQVAPVAPVADGAIAADPERSESQAPEAASTAPAAAAAERPSPPPPPAVTLTLKADLGLQQVTVLEGAEIRHVWAISSGRRGYTTPTGTFRPSWMAKMWHSRQYDWSPMPHSVFFNGGIAFHATSAVSLLGRPASHGCIRLAPANAAELYALVRRHGLAHTKVVVHGTPRFPEPAVARRAPAGTRPQIALGRQRTPGQVSPYGWPAAPTPWLFVQ